MVGSIKSKRLKKPELILNILNIQYVMYLVLVGSRVDGRSMQLPLGGRHGWANVWGRTQGSPIMSDSPLCPKVAATPRYVIRIPSINPESDKSQILFTRKAEREIRRFLSKNIPTCLSLSSSLCVARQLHSSLCACCAP